MTILQKNRKSLIPNYVKVNTFRMYDIGFSLILFIFLNILFSTIMLLLNVPVAPWFVIVSFGINCFVLLIVYEKRVALQVILGSVIIIIISVVLSTYVFDISYDGNTYRKTIVYMLSKGYNPLFETFYDSVERIGSLQNQEWAPWYDAYPKGSELFASTLYSLTKNIESGKSFNLISMIAVFLVSYDIIKDLFKLKSFQAIICSLFLSFNPVTLCQATTFYNDGMLGSCLFLSIISLIDLIMRDENTRKHSNFILLFISISIGINLKFSAAIYFALFAIPFYIYWIIRKFKSEKNYATTIRFAKKLTFYFAFCVTISVGVLGLTSYVINLFRFHNPLYPMIGEGKIEIITTKAPSVIKDKNHLWRFVYSFFSTSSTNGSIKLPFTFNRTEITKFFSPDTRLGGWGILFSGIVIISLILIIGFIGFTLAKQGKWLITILILLGTIFIPIIFVPGFFWARYFPQFFIIPVIALIILYNISNTKPGITIIFPLIFVLLMSINHIPGVFSIKNSYEKTDEINKQITILGDINKKYTLSLKALEGESLEGESFQGPIINLMDAGIEFTIDNNLQIYDGEFYKNYRVAYAINNEKMEFLRDFKNYLSILKNPKYLVLIAIKDEGTMGLSESSLEQFKLSGFKTNFENSYRKSYLAIINGGNIIYEESDTGTLQYQGLINGLNISLISKNYDVGNTASIKVNNIDYAVNSRGFNIVIVEPSSGKLIDSVAFDTFEDSNKITRYYGNFEVLMEDTEID